jgi:hypothetical protein
MDGGSPRRADVAPPLKHGHHELSDLRPDPREEIERLVCFDAECGLEGKRDVLQRIVNRLRDA